MRHPTKLKFLLLLLLTVVLAACTPAAAELTLRLEQTGRITEGVAFEVDIP